MPHVLAQDLRNAVLQAAIQGRLTSQQSSDSDVYELIAAAEKEKEILAKEKIIKKEKPQSSISDDEVLYDLPDNWATVRLGDYIFIRSGDGLTSSKYIKGPYPVYGGNGINGYHNAYNVPKGTLVIGRVGFYCGSVHETIDNAWVTDNALIVTFLSCFSKPYLKLLLTALDLGKNTNQTAQPLVTGKIIKPKIAPLPPIEEQARIVARVDELMAKIDEYEKIEKELTELQKVFPGAMKDAILQAALTGLLSETHQEDTAVTLTIDESIKSLSPFKWKSKTDTSITDVLDLIGDPEIPDTWTWVKLKDIAYSYIGLTYSPANKSSDGTLVLRSSNIKNGKMDYSDVVRVDMDVPKNKICEVGDILMCSRNGSKSLVGKTAIIDKPDMAFGAFMAIIKSQFNRYLFVFFNSYMFKKQMHLNSSTETINQITQDMLWNCVIPFPPIEEQQRIVDKLDQLLPLCEQLDKLTN